MNVVAGIYCLLFSVAVIADTAVADEQAGSVVPAKESRAPLNGADPIENPGNWLDSTHSYVSGSTDALAAWIDRFFGLPRSDIESAYSSLRLTLENDWLEGGDHNSAVRLRGKVHLPRINKRLSLIFTDESGEDDTIDNGVSSVVEGDEETKVALQYKAREKLRSRLDYRLGIRSSLKARASVRYRYEMPWGEDNINRFTETLYFIDGEGFGSRSQYDLDHILASNKLLRWANVAKFAEDTDGVEWSSRVLLAKRLDPQAAVSYFVWAAGKTRPDYLNQAYGLGVRYRRNFYRPWLFYELEPAYAWRRETRMDQRDGRLQFSAKIEILLEGLSQ